MPTAAASREAWPALDLLQHDDVGVHPRDHVGDGGGVDAAGTLQVPREHAVRSSRGSLVIAAQPGKWVRGYGRSRELSTACLPPPVRQPGPAELRLDRPRGGRDGVGRRRHRVRRRDGQPVVLRRRPRTGRDRRRRRRPARHPRRLLLLRAVHQPTGRRARRPGGRADADRLGPGLLLRVRLGSGRHGDEAVPAHPRPRRAARAHPRHQPRARLPRHQLRRDERPGDRAQPGRVGPAGARCRAGAERRRRGDRRADGRAPRRGRRRARRAGAGCRRGVPARQPTTSPTCAASATATARC